MHELALAESLITQLGKIAEQERTDKIISVKLLIGTFSGVDTDALEFALPFAAENTPFENTRFIFQEVKLKLKCSGCGKEAFPAEALILCPLCGSDDVEIIQGREFVIKEIETP